ncbi:MATE family efflux transporter [Ideonella sp. B7]|uniref:MATE family efflux transporter n=1 Tax=Ideonella benzenivorans TaxID=2831643 RepID=UPI001CEDD80F|nr:MATE family efflux transporter [Ideonella benzenivorans]MCA6215003.1 MATE family efflux transporter [Ideonella benzenivorans]
MSAPSVTDVATTARPVASPLQRWLASVRRILPLAWPVYIGQLAVLAFNTVDTLVVARHSAVDLAAFAVGSAAYMTVIIGFMGVVLAVSPVTGQLHGAGRHEAAGDQAHQGIWLALVLSALGALLLWQPEPFLWMAQATPEVAERTRGYLHALAWALPAALIFAVFRAFSTAVSRPKPVMLLQLGGLLLKVPLTVALVAGVPALHLPALGVAGCGWATAAVLWLQVLGAWLWLRRDGFYARFRLFGEGLRPPHRPALWGLLRLGLPMGAGFLIEVTGFSFMALFIARLGTTPVAGHQIAMNLISLMFMLPMSLGNATSTLVAQQIGAGELKDARRLGWHGLWLGCGLAVIVGSAVYLARTPVLQLYTDDAQVVAATLPLLAWLAIFHVADAMQTVVAFTLRAWRVATAPMVVYAVSLWGVGLGGGYLLAFNVLGQVPDRLQGAPGFWTAATVGLLVAGTGLTALQGWVLRRRPQAVAASA